MREIRKSGSEGGAAQANESSLPLCPSLSCSRIRQAPNEDADSDRSAV